MQLGGCVVEGSTVALKGESTTCSKWNMDVEGITSFSCEMLSHSSFNHASSTVSWYLPYQQQEKKMKMELVSVGGRRQFRWSTPRDETTARTAAVPMLMLVREGSDTDHESQAEVCANEDDERTNAYVLQHEVVIVARFELHEAEVDRRSRVPLVDAQLPIDPQSDAVVACHD